MGLHDNVEQLVTRLNDLVGDGSGTPERRRELLIDPVNPKVASVTVAGQFSFTT